MKNTSYASRMRALSKLSDEQVESGLRDSFMSDREEFVAQLLFFSEMHRRKLYGRHTSLWGYVTTEFHVEGNVAQRRIRASRMLARDPDLLEGIESGKMNLSLMELAEAFFRREGITEAEDRWKIYDQISGLSVRAAQRELSRKSPEEISTKDRIRWLDGERVEVRLVLTVSQLDQLEEIRGLLAHSHPGIGLSDLIELVGTEYLERHHPEHKARRAEQRATAAAASPVTEPLPAPADGGASSADKQEPTERRRPSASLVHALTLRDGYKCSFIDPLTKKACGSRYALEIDHVKAWAHGGKTELQNVRWTCKVHNLRAWIVASGRPHALASNPRL